MQLLHIFIGAWLHLHAASTLPQDSSAPALLTRGEELSAQQLQDLQTLTSFHTLDPSLIGAVINLDGEIEPNEVFTTTKQVYALVGKQNTYVVKLSVKEYKKHNQLPPNGKVPKTLTLRAFFPRTDEAAYQPEAQVTGELDDRETDVDKQAWLFTTTLAADINVLETFEKEGRRPLDTMSWELAEENKLPGGQHILQSVDVLWVPPKGAIARSTISAWSEGESADGAPIGTHHTVNLTFIPGVIRAMLGLDEGTTPWCTSPTLVRDGKAAGTLEIIGSGSGRYVEFTPQEVAKVRVQCANRTDKDAFGDGVIEGRSLTITFQNPERL